MARSGYGADVERVSMILDSLSPAQRKVLIALKKLGEASADELAAALGISSSAVRQHLTGLRASGYVAHRPARGRPGRPVDLYHSTDDGDALFAPNASSLTLELLEDLEAEDPELIGRVFRRREQRRAEAFRSELEGLDLPAQLAKLTELLDHEGYLAQWAALDDGTYVLSFNNCAIWNVAEHYVQACSTELDFLRHVFTDAKVKRLVHRRDGSFTCGYEIRPIAH
jgi:DeoR family suf operon transcriptional repressor